MPGYTQPAGSFPVGFLLPNDFDDGVGPPGILADAVDPRTGEYVSITRSFDPTDAAVLLAMSVERGTGASVEDIGHRYFDLELLDDQAESFFEQETRRANKRLIDARHIRPERVEVLKGDDWAEVQFHYVNEARKQQREAIAPARKVRP